MYWLYIWVFLVISLGWPLSISPEPLCLCFSVCKVSEPENAIHYSPPYSCRQVCSMSNQIERGCVMVRLIYTEFFFLIIFFVWRLKCIWRTSQPVLIVTTRRIFPGRNTSSRTMIVGSDDLIQFLPTQVSAERYLWWAEERLRGRQSVCGHL